MPFEPKMHLDPMDPKPFDSKPHRPCHGASQRLNEKLQGGLAMDFTMDFTDLPDESAVLAAQLADDADMLQATFPGAPPAALAGEARDTAASLVVAGEVSRGRVLRTAWSWTRIAALLMIAAGTASAAIWQWQVRGVPGQSGHQAGTAHRVAPQIPSIPSHVATANMSSSASADEASAATVISLEVAVGLSGEKIEVLADAFAAAAVEI
jgi:hypothetical protein